MKRQIRRLRLHQGDIVVVENYETCKRLQQAAANMDLPKGVTYVPILVAPEGVRLISVDKLEKMCKRIRRDQALSEEKTFLGEQ
jgi:hypothetical protein